MNQKDNNSKPWSDPRTLPGFNPEWFPQADGKDAPAIDATDRHDRIRLEFLSVYYDLNKSYAQLLEARRDGQTESNEPKTAERAALQEVENVLRNRDELEDRHAALGVMAEPVVTKGFTVDVQFNFGAKPRSPWDGAPISSCFISIPLPPGAKPG